jgi:hypothetical protein
MQNVALFPLPNRHCSVAVERIERITTTFTNHRARWSRVAATVASRPMTMCHGLRAKGLHRVMQKQLPLVL